MGDTGVRRRCIQPEKPHLFTGGHRVRGGGGGLGVGTRGGTGGCLLTRNSDLTVAVLFSPFLEEKNEIIVAG